MAHKTIYLPPKQAPNARANTIGRSGSLSSSFNWSKIGIWKKEKHTIIMRDYILMT